MTPVGKGQSKKQIALDLKLEELEVQPAESAKLPFLLSYSPFFKPTVSRKKNDTIGFEDKDGESFRFGDLEWIRFGPGLDTFDLETLVALIQLINVKAKASKHHIDAISYALEDGRARKSPTKVSEIRLSEEMLINIKCKSTEYRSNSTINAHSTSWLTLSFLSRRPLCPDKPSYQEIAVTSAIVELRPVALKLSLFGAQWAATTTEPSLTSY